MTHWFIRHGHSSGDCLTRNGIDQVATTALQLPNKNFVVLTSPTGRTTESAEIIADMYDADILEKEELKVFLPRRMWTQKERKPIDALLGKYQHTILVTHDEVLVGYLPSVTNETWRIFRGTPFGTGYVLDFKKGLWDYFPAR